MNQSQYNQLFSLVWNMRTCRSAQNLYCNKGMKYLVAVLFCFCPIFIINSIANETNDTIPQVYNDQAQITASKVYNEKDVVINSSEIIDYLLERDKRESKNQDSGFFMYAPFFISILAITFSFIATFISTKSSSEVKMHDIKMRTANIIVAKRLEVFPKLHVLTDTLGAAIRYYNIHKQSSEPNEKQINVLKQAIKDFYIRLADWDANYCIYGGDKVTQNISVIRHGLEEVDVWDDSELTQDDIDKLYGQLTSLEHALKDEMDIYFIEDCPKK